MRQIALPLSACSSDRAPRIIVGQANAAAIDALSEPRHWPFGTAILSGPPRSGKSLLARWFAQTDAGDAVDEADTLDEDALFHRWNRAQESGRPLLLVASRHYGKGEGQWQVALPDLASRLGAALQLGIEAPDDEMLAALIEIHAEMRGLVLDAPAVQYLAGRCERSHLGVEKLVAAIDRLSLERKAPPTLAIWRDALAETHGDTAAGR